MIFDDEHLVANARLIQPATLAQHLGLRALFNDRVDLGDAHANVGDKAMTLVHSALAGGDSISDADALRAGSTGAVLGHGLRAPSTLGTFLRSFTWGHARQLDVVSGELLSRAWAAGAGPGDDPFTIDVDSSICETYGLAKQGGAKFTYNPRPRLPPAVRRGRRHRRGGPCPPAGRERPHRRGAASFITETVSRVRTAGATGPITLRADSGFYNRNVISACRKADVRFSVTAKLHAGLRKVVEAIPEQDWQPIPYFCDGAAVAEVAYRPFAKDQPMVRLIVRRVPPTPGGQLALFTDFAYHPFITDRTGDMLLLEADHRAQAEIENAIRDLKYGVGLNHMPFGRFGANAAWLAINVIAHNLARWTTRIGGGEGIVTTDTLRAATSASPAGSPTQPPLHPPPAHTLALGRPLHRHAHQPARRPPRHLSPRHDGRHSCPAVLEPDPPRTP